MRRNRREWGLTIDLESLHVESLDEVLPETLELAGDIGLILNRDVALGKASRDGLVNVDNVREISPSIWSSDQLLS